MLMTAIFGGGIGGYFNPDLPILGPLMQSFQSIQNEDASGGLSSVSLENKYLENRGDLSRSQPQTLSNTATGAGSGPAPAVLVSTQRPGDRILIASFNIQVFGTSKMAKSDVMNVIIHTIRQFDIVAIQEVRAKDDEILPKLVAALNQDGSRYNFLIGPRLGRTVSTEQYAYVYDTNRVEYDPTCVGTIPDPKDLLHREPFVARFRPRTSVPERAFSFWLVNIHTDPDDVPHEVDALADMFQMMRTLRPDEDDVILLGDFNASETQMGRLGKIPGITMAVRGAMTNTRQTKAYDNIIFDSNATGEYSGRWGVFNLTTQYGLTTEQALLVSDHFPVWAEFGIWESVPQQLTQIPQELKR
jgi:deoxyribonuclease-1-like protein